jgi:VIT1/CCC1 family predicted Fe2+/Mn2+ transporter
MLARGGLKMSFIDVVLPAIIGLVALVRPQIMFYGSRATLNEKKIRVVRGVGVVLLAAALIYLGIKLVAA